MTTRIDGRRPDALRPVHLATNVLDFAEGSCLVEFGRTRVLCAASMEDRQPPFLRNTQSGWVTAEYSMLPRATHTRSQREVERGRPGGRTQEIQRLIGRSLRSVMDMSAIGERTIAIDCDVLQADGGTRTAAITGAYVALALACDRIVRDDAARAAPREGLLAAKLREAGLAGRHGCRQAVAAVSAGIVDGQVLLDLAYAEDSRAEVDFNVVMTEDGRFVEVQGTAEGEPFPREALDRILGTAEQGIRELLGLQRQALAALRGG